MRKKLESDTLELEEERERFEREKKAWEAANNITVEELHRKSLESISREWVMPLFLLGSLFILLFIIIYFSFLFLVDFYYSLLLFRLCFRQQ